MTSFIQQKIRGVAAAALSAAFLFIAAVSCSPFAPAARHGNDEVMLPDAYTVQGALADPGQQWWEAFDDSQLNDLVTEALSGNQELASYWARLEKSRAQARKAGAYFWPALSGEAGAAYSRGRTDDGTTSATSESENYSLGLAASYELDLWGRIRASRNSALLEEQASRADLNSAAMTIAAAVAERWVAILSLKQQRDLLDQQLTTNKTYLDLVELRFRNSLASALDVLQQKQLVEKIRAQIPLVEMQERLKKNQLALLLGRMPQDLPEIVGERFPVPDEIPPAGLPADLLQNRPDIAAALKRLEAADQDLVAARGSRLPALKLTGSGSYGSDDLELLFDNWIANLAAGLTVPLIDGTRRRAEMEANQAEVQQNLAGFRQIVLTAVREVEDALINETKIREHITTLEKQLEVGQSGLEEARSRYVSGLNDYLPVLTQILSVQGLENDLIRRQEDLLVARISLYRALGGTWADELTPPVKIK